MAKMFDNFKREGLIKAGVKYYKVCRVRCRLCGDVLEHVNQSKTERSRLMLCSCRKVGLDPAAILYRILGNPEDMEDLSEEWPEG